MIHLGLEAQREPFQQRDADAPGQRLVVRDEDVGAGDAAAEIELAEIAGLELQFGAGRQAAVGAGRDLFAVDEEVGLRAAFAAHPHVLAEQEDACDTAGDAAIVEVEPRGAGERRTGAKRVARDDGGSSASSLCISGTSVVSLGPDSTARNSPP